jgi:hypothetical protein
MQERMQSKTRKRMKFVKLMLTLWQTKRNLKQVWPVVVMLVESQLQCQKNVP